MSENNNFDDEIIDVSSDPVPSTSMSINEEPLYYPVNEKIKTGFGRMIRSSLPNIGNHLKRLMRFKSQREVNSTADNERSEVVEVMEIEDQDEDEDEHLNVGVGTEPEPAIYNQTVAIDLNDSFQSSNLASGFTIDHHPSLSIFLDNNQVSSSSSAQMEISIRPSNLFQYYSNPLPLASSSPFTNDLPAESDLTISTLYYPNEDNPLMISQSINTSSHVVYDMTLANIINEEGAIVARNPLEFAATLDISAGDESSHRIAHEPRRVPLIVSNNNNHVSSLNVDVHVH
ncbi:Protein of unknown function [Cotesia congregata]|uniref:Uncharacterized protein n=1 Tax=Cotesia congregata TaxID=51543 RepID=A0A8J2HU49_COTCN|nr:Protein of unknown function [Cotesia congregata]